MIRADSKKVYVIRTEDIFMAFALKVLDPDQSFLKVGPLWAELALTDDQAAKYPFPKEIGNLICCHT